jgi:hypothetical protein
VAVPGRLDHLGADRVGPQHGKRLVVVVIHVQVERDCDTVDLEIANVCERAVERSRQRRRGDTGQPPRALPAQPDGVDGDVGHDS